MHDMSFADPSSDAVPVFAVSPATLERWCETAPPEQAAWVRAAGYGAAAGAVLLVPGDGGRIACALAGLGGAADLARKRFVFAAARAALPEGTYRLETDAAPDDLTELALGWLLAGYRYRAYTKPGGPLAALVAPDGVDATRLERIAAGEALTRDLINTPASDMGPDALEAAARALAERHAATIEVTSGAALEAGFPMIHTVGNASPRRPRLIDLRWGRSGPRVTLVGKGVCFDTGGLNLKPGASMGLMKKDMGGAAAVLGLAEMIMATGTEVQLRVLVPAVENAVGGAAFRPQDILRSRKGLSVEINNTDAEGRLVLADALALADEEETDLIVSMATLTGAARVALGPDLAPYFTDAAPVAAALDVAGDTVRDPVWRLPFWDPYEAMIEPGIADLDNAPKGGFAGAITAALFLRRFVEAAPRYVHFDIYGWQPADAPGRPKGGVGQGTRALFAALPGIASA